LNATTASQIYFSDASDAVVYPGRYLQNTYQAPETRYKIIEREVVKERVIREIIIKEVEKPDRKEKDMSLTSISGILFVVVICIVVSKVILPRMTWKYAIHAFIGLIYKPYREQAKTIKAEWSAAEKN